MLQIEYFNDYIIYFHSSLRHSLPSPVIEAVGPTTSTVSSQSLLVSEQPSKGHEVIKGPLTKQQSRKSKAKETSPQLVSTSSSKAKRSSSKKKKSAASSSTGCSVLDQV